MSLRSRRLVYGSIATLMGVGGWLCVIAARWDRVEGIAFSVLVVALIATGYAAWFAHSAEGRAWWYGFALFGMFHLLAIPGGPRQALLSAGVDQLANLAMGRLDENGNVIQDENGRWPRPTRLGKLLGPLPVIRDGSPNMSYPQYVRSVTKVFASLAFGCIGGMTAVYLGRNTKPRNASTGERARVPPLGVAAMFLVATLAGFTFILDSRPEYYQPGWFPIAPGCLAGHFALYQTEALAVLFAALEWRFGDRSTRAWWLGFALFGGVYLLLINTALFTLLPSRWLAPWHAELLERFVADRGSQVVNVRGWILMDYSTQEFFQLGHSWAPLFGFLPAAWIGSGVARGVAWLARRRPASIEVPRRRRSTILRMMVAVGALGLFLAAVRGKSELWVALVGDGIAALLIGAALWAALGRGARRAWWFGFALVGGVDLLLYSTRAGEPTLTNLSSTPWPSHRGIERLFKMLFESSPDQPVPGMFESFDAKRQVVANAYYHGRSILLMGSCLPMAWIGATIAQWIESRRRRAGMGSGVTPFPGDAEHLLIRGRNCYNDASPSES